MSTSEPDTITSTSSNSTPSIPSMHEKRWFAGVSSIENNSFIVIGGDRSNFSCEVYDGNANKWTRLPEDMPKKSSFSCAAARIDRNIYVVGCDIGTLAYSLDTKKWVQKKEMKTYRRRCAAAACNSRLFVFGNINDAPGTDTDTAEVYDPMTDTWKDLPNMPRGHGVSVPVTVDDKIYIIGGYRYDTLKLVDIFNVTTEQWEKGPDMPSPRYGHAAVAIGKFIVVTGGISDRDSTLSSTLIYDVNEKKWSNGPSMSTARHYHTAAAINVNTVVIAGGFCAQGDTFERTSTSTAEMITFDLNRSTSERNGTSKSLISRTKVLEKELGINIEGSMRMRIRQMETKVYGSTKEGILCDRLDKLEKDLIGESEF